MIVHHIRNILRHKGWSVYRFHQEAQAHCQRYGIKAPHYRSFLTLVDDSRRELSFELLNIVCGVLDCQPGELYSYQLPHKQPATAPRPSKLTSKKKPAAKKKPASSSKKR